MNCPERSTQLTDLQRDMFDSLLSCTWKEAMQKYNITSKSAFRCMTIRTALGYPWSPGQTGGRDPYLSEESELRLVHLLEKSAAEHNCVRTCDVIEIAQQIKLESVIKARNSLIARNCHALAEHLTYDPDPPARSWINSFCMRHKLRLVEPRAMERTRSLACEKSRIADYFLRWMHLFNRDPRLIFGADETDMAPSDDFKVVTDGQHPGYTEDPHNSQHMSAMCCYNAAGAKLPPFILLSACAHLSPELNEPTIDHSDIAWFASSPKGWMNETTFYMWALLFCHWLSGYRAAHLPNSINCAEVLLILDGHGSRRCPEALRLFRYHNVKVLVLPGHCTHLLQAFDVGVASSLKLNFRKFLRREQEYAAASDTVRQSKIARTRLVMVRAFIRAWHASASPQVCARSFELVGICPVCPFIVLDSPFVTDQIKVPDENTDINNRVITDEEVIQVIEDVQARRPKKAVRFRLDFSDNSPDVLSLVHWFMNNQEPDGRLLSAPPTLFWPQNGRFQVLLTFAKSVFLPLHPSRMIEMMRKLSDIQSQRAGEIINETIQQNKEVQQNVIHESAKRIGSAIAQELAEKRTVALFDLASQMVESQVEKTIDKFVHDEAIPPATRQLISENVREIAIMSLEEAKSQFKTPPCSSETNS